MVNQALAYFQEEDVYQHLFRLFKEKYKSLGRIGGSVKVTSFTDEELVVISRFYGISLMQIKEKDRLTLASFESQLRKTRFGELGLKELLEAYFNKPLISNKEIKQQKIEQQNQLITQLIEQFPELEEWLNSLRERRSDSYWVFRLIEKSKVTFEKMVETLDDAIKYLPDSYERLPLFSQRISGNPHAFDLNTNLGKLLIHYLTTVNKQNHELALTNDSEGINELLLAHRILRDDITNYVTCANLIAETSEGMHPMWLAAAEHHSVMNVPLRELIQIDQVYPADQAKQVWIVENSGVYSSILDQLPTVPILCTHGQFKLAGLVLIDQLVQSGCTLNYAGDIDPEGLRMAERIVKRHPGHIKLWKMDLESYLKSESSNIDLSNERLNKLILLTLPDLIPVKTELSKRKNPGYQEALVDEMIEELAECGYT